MDFDEIDDYDGGFPVEDFQQQEPPTINSNSEDDYLTSYLRTKGIEDPNRILFEGENEGETVERRWDELTDEEKFNILNTPSDVEDDNQYVVDEQPVDGEEEFPDEIAFLRQLKDNGMTLQQYLEGIQNNQEPTYKVDDLSDEELFLLDLESRVGELTEEQGAEYLNLAKQNEELFKKQVEGIRKEYKQKEDETAERELAAQEYQAQE
jgi:hypothetical protein